MSIEIKIPFETFRDTDGTPLDAGSIYIGIENQEPIANPANAFWDYAMTIPVTQPIKTLAGYPVRAGTPAKVYTAGAYSITVKNKKGIIVTTSPSTGGMLQLDLADATNALKGAGMVGYDGALAYAAGTVGKGIKDVAAAIAALPPEIPHIDTPTTYYVRTDGNDSNTGLANDAAGAFLTIQAAINMVVSKILMAQVTIQVGDGTYRNVYLKDYAGSVAPYLVGNLTTPASCVITPSSANAPCIGTDADLSDGFGVVLANTVVFGCMWKIGGFKLAQTASPSGEGIRATRGCSVFIIGAMEYGACAARPHLSAVDGGEIRIYKAYTASGAATHHLFADMGGSIRLMDGAYTVTISGTPNLGIFAYANEGGRIHMTADHTITGAVTAGTKYSATMGGLIYTAGKTLPGATGGSTATGGQYA